MAKKDKYSIDDILNEYSVDEKKPVITHTSNDNTEQIISSPDDASKKEHFKHNIELIKNTHSEDLPVQDSSEQETTIKSTVRTDSAHMDYVIPDEPAVSMPVPDPVIPDNSSVHKPVIDTVIPEKPLLTKAKFIDRSPTRIQDKPNKIVRNPQDNIRYLKKTSKDNGTS